MQTRAPEGAPKRVRRPHFFFRLPLKGLYLCLLVLATRKRVNKLFQTYLIYQFIFS